MTHGMELNLRHRTIDLPLEGLDLLWLEIARALTPRLPRLQLTAHIPEMTREFVLLLAERARQRRSRPSIE